MDRDEKIMLAGELALGLLGGEQRRAALTVVASDPEAGSEYRFWQQRFCDGFILTSDFPDVAPPPRLKQKLESQLFGERVTQTFWDKLRAPENRSLVVTVLVAKAALILYLLILFL